MPSSLVWLLLAEQTIAVRLIVELVLEKESNVSNVSALFARVIVCALLDDTRYILCKLAHTRTPKFEDYPSSWQVLLFRVSYPLGAVFVSVDGRHAG